MGISRKRAYRSAAWQRPRFCDAIGYTAELSRLSMVSAIHHPHLLLRLVHTADLRCTAIAPVRHRYANSLVFQVSTVRFGLEWLRCGLDLLHLSSHVPESTSSCFRACFPFRDSSASEKCDINNVSPPAERLVILKRISSEGF